MKSFAENVTPATLRLVEYMRDAQTLSDAEAEELTGKLNGKARSYVLSAIRIVQRENGIMWGRIRGQGWARMEETAKVDYGTGQNRKSYRAASRAVKAFNTVKAEDLPPDKLAQYERENLRARTVRMFASGRLNKRLTAAAKNNELDFAELKGILG